MMVVLFLEELFEDSGVEDGVELEEGATEGTVEVEGVAVGVTEALAEGDGEGT